MAWYFGLYVECGPTKTQADSLTELFHDYQCDFADGLTTTCSAWAKQDCEKNWWVHIWPQGISHASPYGDREELKDGRHNTEAGLVLYNHLRQSNTYRYALAGWEAEEFRLHDEFDSDDFENFDGLVLSAKMWEAHGQPKGYVTFSRGYLWRPWKGINGHW